MKLLKTCPVCDSNVFEHYLTCEDFTVSHERFDIVSCKNCNFKFTNPRPEDHALGNYYKSENYISHSNTKKGVIARLYHLVRNHTLKQKVNLISKYVSRGTILDYGCGTGMFLDACKKAGWKTWGIEPDQGARSIALGMNIDVFESRVSVSNNEPKIKFDIISLWHVLEHLQDLNEVLDFIKSHLQKSGILLIAVPNYKSYDATHYKQFWAAYDLPRHLYHFNPESINRLLTKKGFKLEDALPMKFDSFYVSMLSEKYKSGRVKYLKAFWIGLISNIKTKSINNSSIIYVFKLDN